MQALFVDKARRIAEDQRQKERFPGRLVFAQNHHGHFGRLGKVFQTDDTVLNTANRTQRIDHQAAPHQGHFVVAKFCARKGPQQQHGRGRRNQRDGKPKIKNPAAKRMHSVYFRFLRFLLQMSGDVTERLDDKTGSTFRKEGSLPVLFALELRASSDGQTREFGHAVHKRIEAL